MTEIGLTPSNSATHTLFLFIDESGNFDFSDSGTTHFAMACVAALAPLESAAKLNSLKYDLLAEGHDISSFHASEDKQFIRDRVFSVIDGLGNIRSHVIYGDKHLAAPSLHSAEDLYSLFGKAIMKFALTAYGDDKYYQIVVLFDQALTSKKQGAFMAAVKPELKRLRKPFRIYFHQMKTDANGQIADYICWSKYVELERSENRPWQAIQQTLRSTSFNIFRSSHTRYY